MITYVNIIVAGLLTGAVYGLMALGLSVIFGVTRIVNFAHGEMMVVGMYGALLLNQRLGIDPLVATPLIAAALFCCGYALQRGIINRLIARPEHEQFLLLLAIAIVLTSTMLIAFGPDARNAQVGYAYDSYEIGEVLVDRVRLLAGLGSIVGAALLWGFFRFTRLGKAIRACADNRIGAEVVGLDVKRLYAVTFGIGAACVGVAGCLLLLLVDVQPYLAADYTLLAFIIVIVGGLGSMPGALLGGVLIGVSEALSGFIVMPSLKSLFSFGILILVLLVRPQGLLGAAGVIASLIAGVPRRAALALGLFALAMLVVPFFASNYLVSTLAVALFAAYFGIAWNVMMGFAGQLSLGHALYFGLGAYASGALFAHYGLPPWIGMLAGMAAAGIAGSVIAALSFRFAVTGVYFALLTIAFAEFTRILFDNFAWVGGASGLFLPIGAQGHDDLLNLRGSVRMFYYVTLAATLAALWLSHVLLRRRIGFYWLAIREDEQAAEALGINVFRYKLTAVAISAVMTALGGALKAFYDNNLYPESAFSIGRSIELIIPPIIGGLGTLFGPVLGAFVLTGLGEILTQASAVIGVSGLKQWFYGATLLVIVLLLPAGLWPRLRTLLRLDRTGG